MKRFEMRLAALALLALAGVAGAQGPGCPPGCKVVWVDQPVTCQKLEWHSKDVTCEVMKPVYREEVRTVARDVVVPEWKDETRDVTTCTLKPRQVVSEVSRLVNVPVTVVDPCTGCAYTSCKPQMVVEKVCSTVYDPVTVTTKVPVKVCHYKTEKRNFKETLIHTDWKRVTTTHKEYYCVPVLVTTTQKVPVVVPDCP
jgi:hypothetical protein